MADDPPPSTTTRSKTVKPRAGVQRKTKSEREEYARQQEELAKARASQAESTSKTRAGRGGRGGSARGNARDAATIQKDDRSKGPQPAGGVFGAGIGSRPDRLRSAANAGTSEVLEGQEAIKPDGTTGPSLAHTGGSGGSGGGGGGGGAGGRGGGKSAAGRLAGDNMELASDDEGHDAMRRDIETIWISEDEEAEEDALVTRKGKQRARSKTPKSFVGLRPVRAPRILAEEQGIRTKDQSKKSKKLYKHAGDHSAIINVDSDDMQIDQSGPVKKDAPSSPELTKKILRRPSNRTKDARSAVETVEERAERLRLDEDVRKLRDEFIGFSPTKMKKNKPLDDDEDTAMDDGHPEGESKLFLFQFPPLIPFLIDPTTTSIPTSTTQLADRTSAPPEHPSSISTSAPAPSINDVPIKPEPGTEGPTLPPTQLPGLFTASEPLRLPAGHVGKLRIHKSGKVSLDWGGTDMEVRYGTEVNFLQDAVLVETGPDADPDQTEETKDTEEPKRKKDVPVGNAYALGQVQQKFVVVPDWTKLYE